MLSLTAIEMGLPGFGLEMLADVTHGGAWHIGVLAAPGIPEMLLAGREREFLGQFAFPAMSATPGAITGADIDEFARTYSRPGGWRGAAGLYQSMLREGPEIRALAKTPGLTAPVLAVGAGGGPFTAGTMSTTAAPECSATRACSRRALHRPGQHPLRPPGPNATSGAQAWSPLAGRCRSQDRPRRYSCWRSAVTAAFEVPAQFSRL